LFYNLNQFESNNIEYICKLDVKNLQKACVDWVTKNKIKKPSYTNVYYDGIYTFEDYNPNESKVRYSFNNDIYSFLSRQDLHIYLGTEKNCIKCMMHEDLKHQASLFRKDNGGWIYRCFNESCSFKIGDINKITECLTGLNRPKTLEFLMQVYGVVLEKNNWQIEQEKIIDANIELLLDVETLKDNYPELYKRIKIYIPQLLILHEFAKRNVTLEQALNSDLVTFTAPVRDISKSLVENGSSGDIKNISKRNNILAFIGLLLKLSDDMVLPEQIQKLKDYAEKQGHHNYHNYYAIPSYSYSILNNAENKSVEFKSCGMSVEGFSSKMISSGFGEKELHKIYPRKKISNNELLEDKIAEIIKEKIYNEIKIKGYCIEKDIYDNGYFVRSIKNKLKIYNNDIINKKIVRITYKIYIPELINMYGFIRCRLTKELKEKFNINNINNSPTIIYKENIYEY
jgi:hypothetical protein